MILASILENDLYKFSMSYYYQACYPKAWGRFLFLDRNRTEYSPEFVELLKKEFDKLATLSLREEEFDWAVANIQYIPQYYWEWLRGFRFEPARIEVSIDEQRHLHIEVADLMYRVTMYEIPILAIVSELYHRYCGEGYSTRAEIEEAMAAGLRHKAEIAEQHNLSFADFGLRRRYNAHAEDVVVDYMKHHCKGFVGTSNVYLAMRYNVKPIGTQAHETFMFQAAIDSPKMANYLVMENWSRCFDGSLGTVLTDTYTVDAFLRNFSLKFAKLYDGVRHDSGDPILFGERMVEKYRSYGIDPMSKTIVFSDALDFERAVAIKEYFVGKIRVSFGIGTNLTCDIGGVRPMNIVMKLAECRLAEGQPLYGCVKLSDVEGKAIGRKDDIANYRYQLGIE